MFRTPSRLPLAAAAIAASTVIAACGTNSSNSGRHVTAAQIRQAEQDAVGFADCMRSHGVPNFPDSPYEQKQMLSASSAQAPAIQSAVPACSHLLPHGGQSQSPAHSHVQITAMLAFARCLRSHGFADFPDPTRSGALTHQMLATAGINLQQPALVPAADACVGVTHGVITKTAVARFVAGQ
ncbi:MAG TPA: hypothetical protein VIK04_17015 [Solirubrobacteraceae bacterium]